MALAGDMRYNPDTQMTEVYSGDRWIAIINGSMQIAVAQKPSEQVKDESFYDNFDRYRREFVEEKVKVKALDELFGVK